MEALGGAWRERRDEVVSSAEAIVEHLRPVEKDPEVARPIAGELIDAVGADYDIVHGGFGGPTKFPNATLLDALLVKGDPTSSIWPRTRVSIWFVVAFSTRSVADSTVTPLTRNGQCRTLRKCSMTMPCYWQRWPVVGVAPPTTTPIAVICTPTPLVAP
ncbi:thymidylate kinase [Cutibacterium acnes JCM 18920]|nr:thymidylate kinase [Cutibacterium acnes JCM 18920]